MRVLFAVNNEKISESIIKKYQSDYKEIISAKNVYYFNAIIKELQRNKNYDRIVIGEDLEPYSNRNYEMIDKFLFDKLDNISDEASNNVEGDIPIILICTDRREKGEPILTKLFSIGLYSALIGKDRTIDNLCSLISMPRSKKEAKVYYKIDTEDAEYRSESEDEVNEAEVQNILNHFKKLGRNENAYVTSFNNIATQYTTDQLKLIVGYLPLNVRAVLEENCPEYQKLMLNKVGSKIKEKKEKAVTTKNINVTRNTNSNNIDLINNTLQRPRMSNPVVIPSSVDTNNVKKVLKPSEPQNGINQIQPYGDIQQVPNVQDPYMNMPQAPEVQNSYDNNIPQMQNNNFQEEYNPMPEIPNDNPNQFNNDYQPQNEPNQFNQFDQFDQFDANIPPVQNVPNVPQEPEVQLPQASMGQPPVEEQNPIDSFMNQEEPKLEEPKVEEPVQEEPVQENPIMNNEDVINKIDEINNSNIETAEIEATNTVNPEAEGEQPKKRGRGRPPKIRPVVPIQENMEPIQKRGRGRPRKIVPVVEEAQEVMQQPQPEEEKVDLFNLDAQPSEQPAPQEEKIDLFNLDAQPSEQPAPQEEKIDLFNLDTQPSEQPVPQEEKIDLFNLDAQSSVQSTPQVEEKINLFDLDTSNTANTANTLNQSDINKENDDINLFSIDNNFGNGAVNNPVNNNMNENNNSSTGGEIDLFNMDDSFYPEEAEKIFETVEENKPQQKVDFFSMDGNQPNQPNPNVQNNNYMNANQQGYQNNYNNQPANGYQAGYNNYQNQNPNIVSTNTNMGSGLASLMTSDKKIVAFVGTSKNGTSFLINNVATLLAARGINTAILDLTKNKNAYYIFTQNDESLRAQAAKCIENLRVGTVNGINVEKNLTVYTTLPNETSGIEDYSNILQTLVKNYSLVLLDCDFETDINYFANSSEIYLVQTYDILTIQPLTAFVRELEDKNAIDPKKLRIVINKELKVRNLNEKMIIGGISKYNSPDMTYQKDLFNIDNIMYTVIPFEPQTYAKYLEGLVTCKISLNGYSRGLIDALNGLADMVYPLISNTNYNPGYGNYNNNRGYGNYNNNGYNNYNRNNTQTQFSNSIDNTLNKMRNNY